MYIYDRTWVISKLDNIMFYASEILCIIIFWKYTNYIILSYDYYESSYIPSPHIHPFRFKSYYSIKFYYIINY